MDPEADEVLKYYERGPRGYSPDAPSYQDRIISFTWKAANAALSPAEFRDLILVRIMNKQGRRVNAGDFNLVVQGLISSGHGDMIEPYFKLFPAVVRSKNWIRQFWQDFELSGLVLKAIQLQEAVLSVDYDRCQHRFIDKAKRSALVLLGTQYEKELRSRPADFYRPMKK